MTIGLRYCRNLYIAVLLISIGAFASSSSLQQPRWPIQKDEVATAVGMAGACMGYSWFSTPVYRICSLFLPFFIARAFDIITQLWMLIKSMMKNYKYKEDNNYFYIETP